jgi:hypothetical protein
VRHVRILGLCLVALLALSSVMAGSALASGEGNAAKKEAKYFANCPVGLPQVVQCDYAISGPGSNFQAGNIDVPLNKSEILQGGISENEETETTTFWGAEAGNNTTLKPVSQEVPGGLEGNIEPADLTGAALASYEKAVANGKSKVTLAIELAGPPHPTVSLEFFCFITGECPAIVLPVQVKLSNSFLGKNCTIGNNNDPIGIELTTGTTNPPPPNEPISGSLGSVHFSHEGKVILVENNTLVNNSYASPGATGCGTPQTESQVDAAIDAKTGLPSPAGNNKAIITGTLHIAAASYVKESLRG